ncbi:MAG: T9SS type A sorting domain-containing protein [Candidatus Cloacimonetes bacterium]|nr:T9SS type A sorting domain-containing protein [Candidatus Cloacimonadota bacterium]
MKKIFIFWLLILSTAIFALKNWKIYTNTTHVFDAIEIGDNLKIATWGGLLNYNSSTGTFEKTLTTIDGLGSNDIRALDHIEHSDEFLVGTSDAGINRIFEGTYLTPLTESLGLQSNHINKITHNDTLIFVATLSGVSCFKNDLGFPFPLLLKNYNTENGLSANNITSMQLTQEGFIYFGSNSGLDFVDLDSLEVITSWHHIGEPLLLNNKVTSISVGEDKVAVATEGGLQTFENIYDPDQNEIIHEGDGIFPVHIDQENSIWYGFGFWDDNMLYVQDSTEIAVVKVTATGEYSEWQIGSSNLNTTKITRILELNNRITLLSWGEGIFLKNDDDWQQIKLNSICANIVTDIAIDNNLDVWISNGHFGDGMVSKGTRGVSGFDGSQWENYNVSNSDIKSDNILSIGIDSSNRKWFGAWATNSSATGWYSGISVLDDSVSPVWEWINTYNSGIYTNTISHITNDNENRMWISCYDGGISVLDENAELISQFVLPNDEDQKVVISHNSGNRVSIGSYLTGLRIWEDASIPNTFNDYWTVPPFSDLTSSCRIFDITTKFKNQVEETWIAASAGLFMYNGEDWYKFGPHIKKKIWFDGDWFWNENNPDPEYWYYEGQERLYGSIVTYPTAVLLDPFNMLWIGSQDAGITMFDTSRDKFINYTTANSPLISNTITALEYEPQTGTLYIGTSSGLNSVEIGIAAEMNTESKLFETIAFPNPFYPDQGDILNFENKGSITMPAGKTKCRIFDLNGGLVIELNKNIYEQFNWDGMNLNREKCSSGIYFYLISTPDDQTSSGKFVLVR